MVQIERHHGEKSKTVTEGNDLDLICTVSGYPLPNVTWSHVESILDLTDKQNVTSATNVSVSLGLKVEKMNMSDRGNFVCKATNFFQDEVHVKEDTILVRVKGRSQESDLN